MRKCRSLPLEHKQGCRIPTLTHASVTYVPCTKLTEILSSSGLMSKDLQKAAVNVIGDQACKKFYPVQISSRMVCAGFPHGTVDSCSVSVRAANAAAGPANSCRIPVLLSSRTALPCLPSSDVCPPISAASCHHWNPSCTLFCLSHQPVTGQGNMQRGNTKQDITGIS